MTPLKNGKLKIIYLSKNMDKYSGAHYQRDVYKELARQHLVYLYGPGYPNYDLEDTIKDIIAKSNFDNPDMVCVGHSWLNDGLGKPLEIHSKVNLRECSIPTTMILNKEYARLHEKLEYIEKNEIPLVFSHHHRINLIAKRIKTKFIFWPFAANHHIFFDRKLPKKYDLCFTGMLINGKYDMDNFRLRVQERLFFTIGEIRFFKKNRYRHLSTYWNGQPSTNLLKNIQKRITNFPSLSTEDYAELLNKSRACLNTLSTMNIISPRYFESMASKSLVLCQESDQYQDLFIDNVNCVMVKDDLSNFDDKLNFCLESSESNRIIETAYQYVNRYHTWEKRIEQFVDQILGFFKN